MEKNEMPLIFLIAIFSLIFMGIGALIGQAEGEIRMEKKWQKELIDRDLGEYNKVTGEWQWK